MMSRKLTVLKFDFTVIFKPWSSEIFMRSFLALSVSIADVLLSTTSPSYGTIPFSPNQCTGMMLSLEYCPSNCFVILSSVVVISAKQFHRN